MVVLRRILVHPLRLRNPVAAIGIFDGVHRGHQAILRKAVVRAGKLRGTPVAITFYPHPLTVLAPRLVPPLILSLEQRLDAFARLGIRMTLVIPFTRAFSRWSAETFVKRLLVECLHIREAVVGHDFGFGFQRSGSVSTLRTLGRRFGFNVHVAAPVTLAGERIASNRIRDVIRQGDLAKASRLMGRPVGVIGKVIRGAARGQKLGFPTANLALEAGVLPPVGVYAVRGRLKDRSYPGMANIGFRPTFKKGTLHKGTLLSPDDVSPNEASPVLEVHLFGVRRPLYGKRLEVTFVKWLRPERRFPSAHALSGQLQADARRARGVFALQGGA